MPVKVPDNLPAKQILELENIFIMNESRAFVQDIRPLKIAILNIMPLKEATEVDLLRVLSNSALQIEVTFVHMESHSSKNTPTEHLQNFYKYISDISHEKYDGMIITGAPVEKVPFEDVTYWNELKSIMEWSKSNVTSTIHICWAAQAGLYYHYGVQKQLLDEKLFGVYKHYNICKSINLTRGFDDEYYVPHSRYTTIFEDDIKRNCDLTIVSKSDVAGVNIVTAKEGRQIFITGHFEYNKSTLKNEYERDVKKGLFIDVPNNYFKNNDPKNEPIISWQAHANLLYNNWLNYYVYQETPFDIDKIM